MEAISRLFKQLPREGKRVLKAYDEMGARLCVDRIQSADIFYAEGGSGCPVLLVHGFDSSSYTWRSVFPQLSQEYHVMAIDLPGFGLSSPLQDNPTVANYVEVLREFINKKGLERVRLCGHSFGALLCRALFASFPKQVERVMLISAPLPGAVNPIADGTMNLMLFGYARRDCLTDKDFKVFRDLNLGTPEGLRRIARFPDFEDKLSFDGSRCMLLHGEFDRIVSLDVAGCEDAFPGADLQVLNGVGHVPHEEAPETILRKMKPFFAGSCV